MHQDKVKAALSIALKHIENATNALTRNRAEKPLADALRSASAEVEYALFLLSLTPEGKSDSASWKHETARESMEIGTALVFIRRFIDSARTSVEVSDYEKAYELTWKASRLLSRAQELSEKKLNETTG